MRVANVVDLEFHGTRLEPEAVKTGMARRHRRLKEYRDTYPREHLYRSSGRGLRALRRQLLEKHAERLFDRAWRCRHRDTKLAFFARTNRDERRKDDYFIGRFQLHMAVERLRPGMCLHLQTHRSGPLVAQCQERAGGSAREQDSRWADRELSGIEEVGHHGHPE